MTSIKYTVQPGDRLVDIARRHGVDAESIHRPVQDKNRIYIGETLVIDVQDVIPEPEPDAPGTVVMTADQHADNEYKLTVTSDDQILDGDGNDLLIEGEERMFMLLAAQKLRQLQTPEDPGDGEYVPPGALAWWDFSHSSTPIVGGSVSSSVPDRLNGAPLTVSGTIPVAGSSSTAPLPPTGWESFTSVNLSTADVNGSIFLRNDTDYKIVGTTAIKNIRLRGGRKVVWIAGDVNLTAANIPTWSSSGELLTTGLELDEYPVTGSYAPGQSLDSGLPQAGRSFHIEGVRFRGDALTQGITMKCPTADVTIVNCRVDMVRFSDANHRDGLSGKSTNHPDLIQPYGGIKSLTIHGFTGYSGYQGMFLRNEANPAAAYSITNADIHMSSFVGTNSVTYHGNVGLWPWVSERANTYAFNNVWVEHNAGNVYGSTFQNALRQDLGAQVLTTGTDTTGFWATFGHASISGKVYSGSPGEFVPTTLAGLTYVRPGSASTGGIGGRQAIGGGVTGTDCLKWATANIPQPYTIMFVYKGWFAGAMFDSNTSTASRSQARILSNNIVAEANTTVTVQPTDGLRHVAWFEFNGIESRFYIDGVLVASGDVGTGALVGGVTVLNNRNVNLACDSILGEIMVINGIPAVLERTSTVDERLTKWTDGDPTPPPTSPPSEPVNLAANVTSSTSIGLTWDAPASLGQPASITTYQVSRSLNGTDWTDIATPTTRSYAATGLAESTLYYFRVRASNGQYGAWSSTVTATTTGTVALSEPRSLSANTASSTSISLSWDAPLNNGGSAVTGYQVARSINNSTWTNIATPTGVSYTASGLTTGTLYYFRVRATNNSGSTYGPWSSVVSAVPSATTARLRDKTGIHCLLNRTSHNHAQRFGYYCDIFGFTLASVLLPFSHQTASLAVGNASSAKTYWQNWIASNPTVKPKYFDVIFPLGFSQSGRTRGEQELEFVLAGGYDSSYVSMFSNLNTIRTTTGATIVCRFGNEPNLSHWAWAMLQVPQAKRDLYGKAFDHVAQLGKSIIPGMLANYNPQHSAMFTVAEFAAFASPSIPAYHNNDNTIIYEWPLNRPEGLREVDVYGLDPYMGNKSATTLVSHMEYVKTLAIRDNKLLAIPEWGMPDNKGTSRNSPISELQIMSNGFRALGSRLIFQQYFEDQDPWMLASFGSPVQNYLDDYAAIVLDD